MSDLTELLGQWKTATANLPWGVQRYFMTALQLAHEEKKPMYYGSNYGPDGQPCLVNSISDLIPQGVGRKDGDRSLPTSFGNVVTLFDAINRKVNSGRAIKNHEVSHEASYLLLKHFAPIKTIEQAAVEVQEEDAKSTETYIEPDDASLMREMIDAFSKPPAAYEGTDSLCSTEAADQEVDRSADV